MTVEQLDAIKRRFAAYGARTADTAALIAEVENLGREAQIRVEEERAAIVEWLRAEADAPHPIEAGERALSPSGRGLMLLAADRIERGEHNTNRPRDKESE